MTTEQTQTKERQIEANRTALLALPRPTQGPVSAGCHCGQTGTWQWGTTKEELCWWQNTGQKPLQGGLSRISSLKVWLVPAGKARWHGDSRWGSWPHCIHRQETKRWSPAFSPLSPSIQSRAPGHGTVTHLQGDSEDCPSRVGRIAHRDGKKALWIWGVFNFTSTWHLDFRWLFGLSATVILWLKGDNRHLPTWTEWSTCS